MTISSASRASGSRALVGHLTCRRRWRTSRGVSGDAAHQDEEDESDQVEDHPERGDDTAETKALEEEQDSDKDRESPSKPTRNPRSGWSVWGYRSVGDVIQRASDRSCRPRTGWPPVRCGSRFSGRGLCGMAADQSAADDGGGEEHERGDAECFSRCAWRSDLLGRSVETFCEPWVVLTHALLGPSGPPDG
jgi:hypothetical protein